MIQMSSEFREGVDQLVTSIRRVSAERERPVLVALDGPSGAGKSTVSIIVAKQLDAVVVPADDFFAADITDSEWERRSAAERARDAINWRRLREEAVEPLLAGERAEWYPFDFSSGPLPDGTYASSDELTVREPAPVIIVDGAYSARPELADLIDLSVLVYAPGDIRNERLTRREDSDFLTKWHQRWDAAEEWYFSRVRPSSSFNLVIPC